MFLDSVCTAVSKHHHAKLGPYNTAVLITFLDTLHGILMPAEQSGRPEQLRCVVIWDNKSFHQAALFRNWFIDHPQFIVLNLPLYSPFLNTAEEVFLAWRWKEYDCHPLICVPFLQAIDACGEVDVGAFGGWIRYPSMFFPRYNQGEHKKKCIAFVFIYIYLSIYTIFYSWLQCGTKNAKGINLF